MDDPKAIKPVNLSQEIAPLLDAMDALRTTGTSTSSVGSALTSSMLSPGATGFTEVLPSIVLSQAVAPHMVAEQVPGVDATGRSGSEDAGAPFPPAAWWKEPELTTRLRAASICGLALRMFIR